MIEWLTFDVMAFRTPCSPGECLLGADLDQRPNHAQFGDVCADAPITLLSLANESGFCR